MHYAHFVTYLLRFVGLWWRLRSSRVPLPAHDGTNTEMFPPLSTEYEVHCAEKLVTCFGEAEILVPCRKSNGGISVVQLSRLTNKQKMQTCPCSEYDRTHDPFVQAVEDRSRDLGGAPLCGAAPTGLTKLHKLCKLRVFGTSSSWLATEKLWQWEQQDLSAESGYHKYLLHTLIAKENRSSSTLSGSKVRPLITEASRWHANERDLEKPIPSTTRVLCLSSQLYYRAFLLSV